MKTEAMLRDPVFQLNLLLWMAKEQPPDHYRVKPLFHAKGFRIIYIEQPFPFPEETARAIDASHLEISRSPEPELILGRGSDNKALYFEAKANSFGPESSNCRQARGHLIAAGPAFDEVFAPLGPSLLCYVVPAEARILMAECLAVLAQQLNAARLRPGEHSVHGLAVEANQVWYHWDIAFAAHVGGDEQRTAIMAGVEEDTDPSPLLLVYSDEDCQNLELRDFYRRALLDQVRACLLSELHSVAVGTPYSVVVQDLLKMTTDGLFDYLGRARQKRLRLLIRQNLFQRIHEHWKEKQAGIKLSGDELSITWSVTGEKEAFLDWLEDRRTRFGTERPAEEPSLFDQLDADSEGR